MSTPYKDERCDACAKWLELGSVDIANIDGAGRGECRALPPVFHPALEDYRGHWPVTASNEGCWQFKLDPSKES